MLNHEEELIEEIISGSDGTMDGGSGEREGKKSSTAADAMDEEDKRKADAKELFGGLQT
jgi:hypothetical protein